MSGVTDKVPHRRRRRRDSQSASMSGNTRTIAEAVAAGLADRMRTELVEVNAAPGVLADDVDLLAVGGPTPTFGMSRPATRRDAARQLAAAARPAGAVGCADGIGIREWLTRVDSAGPRRWRLSSIPRSARRCLGRPRSRPRAMAAGLTATVLSGLRDYHRDKWREKMVARSIEKGMTTSDFADDFIVERASSEDAADEPDDVQVERPYQTGPDSRQAQTLRAFEQQGGDIVSEGVFHTPRPRRSREIPRDE